MPNVNTEPLTSKLEDGTLTRWGHISRLAIAGWLEECISGNANEFFHKFAPYSKYWKVRTDTDEADPSYPLRRDNPLERPINVSRYFENTPERPPQMLIRDGGWTRTTSNLGSFSIGYGSADGTQTAAIIDDIPVSVEITCAAMDLDDTNRMVHFVETAFGPLGVYFHRGVLRPQAQGKKRWSVFLPLSSVTVGGVSDTPMGEDRKNRIWTQAITLETRVEAVVWSQYPFPHRNLLATPDGLPNTLDPIRILVEPTLRVGEQVLLRTNHRPVDSEFSVNNFRLALVDGDLLLAKRPGSVEISLRLANRNGVSGTVFATATTMIQP